MPAINRKDGTPTAYGMACGYTMERMAGNVRTVLWREGTVYHVRAHDFDKHERVFWEVFTSYNKARAKFYKEQQV